MRYSAALQSPTSLAEVGHWQGELHLHYQLQQTTNDLLARTVLARRSHNGPFTVQRPFYPEGPVCHTVLLHPPGGLVEGDSLTLFAELAEQTHVVITSPSAGKVYECDSESACQLQKFKIADKAVLEWFPQEMILYDRARARFSTQINLTDDAAFAGWEIICLGRPVCGDVFASGSLNQMVELYRDGIPQHIERLSFTASSGLQQAAYGLTGFSVMATFLMTGTKPEHLENAREIAIVYQNSSTQQMEIGFTQIRDLLIGRILVNQSRHAKSVLSKIYSDLRPEVLGLPFNTPRIWAT